MAGRDKPKEFDRLIKLLMIGDSGVGKSNLLLRYVDQTYNPTIITTIGIDFKIKTIDHHGMKIKLQIWDTAGHARFRTITTSYFRGAQGFLLVYDATDRQTFESIRNWISQVRIHADPDVKLVLVCNKCDCDKSEVFTEEGQALARELGIPFYYEVSARYDINVTECFECVVGLRVGQNELFIRAARDHREQEVERFIRSGTNINYRDSVIILIIIVQQI